MTKYVFVDIESTGCSTRNDKIIEIAAVVVEDFEIKEVFSTLVNPQKEIPWFISKLTGLNDRMVEESPVFEEIAEKIKNLFNNGVFVAHNASFDYSFLRSEFERANITFEIPRLCTVKLSQKLFPEHRKHNLDSIIGRMKLNKQISRHRALDDAMIVVEFYKKIYTLFEKEVIDEKIRLLTI